MKQADAIALTVSATQSGTFAGRVWRTNVGPAVVALRNGRVIDITSKTIATMRDLCEAADTASLIEDADDEDLCGVDELLAGKSRDVKIIAPIDLQAIKAAGVTFASSMLERVIEEKARGDASLADAIRADITRLIGDDLSKLVPGSPEAMALKQSLIEKKSWSQYLEVGIGPDPEIFTPKFPEE